MDFLTSLFKASNKSLHATKHQHPYYPIGVNIVGYLANTYSVPYMLGVFAAACALVLGSTVLGVRRIRPSISTSETYTVMWFVLCGCIHLFFEGYYSYNFRTIASESTILAQLWKEYAHSDSRYLTQDPFVLCMESITAFLWGPLSFYIAYLITVQSPLRHPFQTIVSLGQLYGDVLYYSTSLFDAYFYNRSFSRPEAWYFWGYYVLMNWFWIVIPLCLIVSSVRESKRAFTVFEAADKTLKIAAANGVVANGVVANGHAKAGSKKTR